MANYLQSYFVHMLCSLRVPLANLYAHANFYTPNYINKDLPPRGRQVGGEQIKSIVSAGRS